MAGLIFRAKFVIFLSTLSLRRATSAPAIKSCWSSYFYPRSPCGERPKSANTLPAVTLFLSTLSLRRATYTAICLAPPILFLSTLSLRRATPQGCFCYLDNIVFYPRSPCGERRIGLVFLWWGVRISIHALLAESDWCISRKQPVQAAFLSTLSLRRATVSKRRLPSSCRLFLSTLSLRRATVVHIAEHASPGRFLSTLSLRRATRTHQSPDG